MSENLQLTIDLNVLNHLGLGLYSSTPAIVTEIVSNAWDAEASWVRITLDNTTDSIVVEDNGHGMTRDDVKSKFLTVGYSRRGAENNTLSKNKKRKVMGRKGIGKLAMFSLANNIQVVTKPADSDPTHFVFDVPKLRDEILAGRPYNIQEETIPKDFKLHHGTRIVLKNLNAHINRTEAYLRPRLARRFAIMDPEDNFSVQINETEIKPDDREYFKDIQCLWYFDEKEKNKALKVATNIAEIPDDAAGAKSKIKCVKKLDDLVLISGLDTPFSIRGFIATVKKPTDLGKDEESINQISIFANKRVFQTDVLNEIGNAKYYNKYMIGEIHADFLDEDDVDRATASREAVKHNDPKYIGLIKHLKTALETMAPQWDEWRAAIDPDFPEQTSRAISEWLDTLPEKRDRKLAEKMIGSINKNDFATETKNNQEIKATLVQAAISGFEKLRIRRQLDKLEGLVDVFSPEFMSLFLAVDDIEASYYLDITRQRLQVIEKLEQHMREGSLEKVVEQYIFKHLWLLDPTWDRIPGSEETETVLTKHLKAKCPESDEGARIDIAYMTSSARHVIVELKRPGLKTPFDKLSGQARKYIIATTEFFSTRPDLCAGGRIPHIDVYILVSEKPKPPLDGDETTLKFQNIQFLTYQGLISNARKSYQEYLDAQSKTSRIDKIMEKLKAQPQNPG